MESIAVIGLAALAAGKWLNCGAQREEIPCYLLSQECIQSSPDDNEEMMDEILKHAVIIDFGKQMLHWKKKVKAYRDLSPLGIAKDACLFVNSLLEWAYQVPGACFILVPYIKEESEFSTTLRQRFRAETRGADPILNLKEISIQLPSVQGSDTSIASSILKDFF